MKYFKLLVLVFVLLNIPLTYAQEEVNDILIGKTLKLESKILNEKRNIFIYLANGYNLTTTKYPVLYLLDANDHFIHASGTVSFLSGNFVIPQTIIVGIPNTIRGRDFTPTKTEALQLSGDADKFLRFMKEELIPFIDNNYRTEPHRILFGHSLTAMFSIYTLLTNPELVNEYITASPYVMYDNNYVVELAKKNLPKSFKSNKYLYITLGNEPDYFNALNELIDLFKSKTPKNFRWDYTFLENDDHGTVPLKTIYEGLQKIYEGWRLPPGLANTGNFESIKDHFNKLSEKYGYEVRIPERVLNIFGYQVMFEGRTKEAVEIFKKNIELYPESVNVYDSLGEGLEADNKLEEAQKYYEIAFEKGRKVNDPNLNFYKQHLDSIQKKLAE